MTKIIVIIGFLVSFAAGLIVGMETRQTSSAAPTTRPTDRRGILPAELNLTSAQQEAMKKIWEPASHGWHDQEDRRRQFRRERDEAIAALVHPEDTGKLDQICDKYSEQLAAMDREAHESFQKKVAESNELLTPDQRTKYAEFLRRHQWGGRDHETTRRGDAGATSRPTS